MKAGKVPCKLADSCNWMGWELFPFLILCIFSSFIQQREFSSPKKERKKKKDLHISWNPTGSIQQLREFNFF